MTTRDMHIHDTLPPRLRRALAEAINEYSSEVVSRIHARFGESKALRQISATEASNRKGSNVVRPT